MKRSAAFTSKLQTDHHLINGVSYQLFGPNECTFLTSVLKEVHSQVERKLIHYNIVFDTVSWYERFKGGIQVQYLLHFATGIQL